MIQLSGPVGADSIHTVMRIVPLLFYGADATIGSPEDADGDDSS